MVGNLYFDGWCKNVRNAFSPFFSIFFYSGFFALFHSPPHWNHCHRFHFLSGCARRNVWSFRCHKSFTQTTATTLSETCKSFKSFLRKIYLNDATLCKENPRLQIGIGAAEETHKHVAREENEDALKAFFPSFFLSFVKLLWINIKTFISRVNFLLQVTESNSFLHTKQKRKLFCFHRTYGVNHVWAVKNFWLIGD